MTSTDTTKSPRATLAANVLRSASGVGAIPMNVSAVVTLVAGVTGVAVPPSIRTELAIHLMWSGVVPQQPPTILAPSWIMRRAKTSKYSGVAMYRSRPSMFRGRPALGCTHSGRPATRIRSATASASCGPSPQLKPSASAPQSRRHLATCSGVDPSATVSFVSKVIEAMIGRFGAPCRAAAMATAISSRWRKVSSTSTSAPPSARAAACSAKVSRARSSSSLRETPGTSPVGPIEPPTHRSSPATCRASRAPARL